jgi:hypothetical protein
VMPSNFATLAPPGRVMAAVPANLAAMAEAGRGEPYLMGHQAVLVADQAVANLCARRIDGGRFCGRRRDQGCRSNGDNSAH